MKLPLSKEELIKITIIHDFNEAHGTNMPHWNNYYEELGITRSEASNLNTEYTHYLMWFAIKDSPLYKALR